MPHHIPYVPEKECSLSEGHSTICSVDLLLSSIVNVVCRGQLSFGVVGYVFFLNCEGPHFVCFPSSSQNCKMVGVGRGLKDHHAPIPLPWARDTLF